MSCSLFPETDGICVGPGYKLADPNGECSTSKLVQWQHRADVLYLLGFGVCGDGYELTALRLR